MAHARGLANRKGRTHDLGKMTLPDLVKAYFLYPAVITYLALSAISIGVIAYTAQSIWPLIVAAGLAALIYPLVWYCLHRFVLHGSFLYKSPLTASTWKRIHYDHHQDPNDLRVLFGALYTTLPTIGGVTLPIGWLIGGLPGAAAAFASGLLTTCFYEYCHCVQHLKYLPKSRFLRQIKQLHMAHHFHNEHGNYGITNFLWDRLFGTLYKASQGRRPQSDRVQSRLRRRSGRALSLGRQDFEAAGPLQGGAGGPHRAANRAQPSVLSLGPA